MSFQRISDCSAGGNIHLSNQSSTLRTYRRHEVAAGRLYQNELLIQRAYANLRAHCTAWREQRNEKQRAGNPDITRSHIHFTSGQT